MKEKWIGKCNPERKDKTEITAQSDRIYKGILIRLKEITR